MTPSAAVSHRYNLLPGNNYISAPLSHRQVDVHVLMSTSVFGGVGSLPALFVPWIGPPGTSRLKQVKTSHYALCLRHFNHDLNVPLIMVL